MQLRTGVDLIEIERLESAVERHGRRFLERIFTQAELDDSAGKGCSLAGRFAAKEAVSKALGTGIGPVAWTEIEVRTGPGGEPSLQLHGAAASQAQSLGLTRWSLSLSHSRQYAVAFVVGLGD